MFIHSSPPPHTHAQPHFSPYHRNSGTSNTHTHLQPTRTAITSPTITHNSRTSHTHTHKQPTHPATPVHANNQHTQSTLLPLSHTTTAEPAVHTKPPTTNNNKSNNSNNSDDDETTRAVIQIRATTKNSNITITAVVVIIITVHQ